MSSTICCGTEQRPNPKFDRVWDERVVQEEKGDLMIMGAYGQSPLRELIFGGCTRSAIEAADVSIFLMH